MLALRIHASDSILFITSKNARGRSFFNFCDRIEDNDSVRVVSEMVSNISPSDPPLLTWTQHGRHDVDKIEADLRAGLSTIQIDGGKKERRASTPPPAIAIGKARRSAAKSRRGIVSALKVYGNDAVIYHNSGACRGCWPSIDLALSKV
jgi:hypothetical protein